MRRNRVVACLALAVLVAELAACSPEAIQPSAATATAATADTASSPRSEPVDVPARTACATRVLQSLVTAINAGDAASLEHLIGSGPAATQAFQWFSLTIRGPLNSTDYSADAARRSLLARAASGERWTLTSVLAPPGPSWHSGVDAEVHLERTLADHSVVRTGGKTALSCIGSAVYVLSLGDD